MPPTAGSLKPRLLLETGCELGEGPLWDVSRSTLHFVDIGKRQVLHYNTKTSQLLVDQFDEAITCLSLRRNNEGLACTTARGFAIIEPGSSHITYLDKPLSDEYTRFNDGACDRNGRFFAGTIYSPDHNIDGKLFCYDPGDGSSETIDDGMTDSNGMGWSSDDKIFYFTDSIRNRIYAYDYDLPRGRASNRRVFIDASKLGLVKNRFAPEQDSYCDGLCIDSEGGIWSARWGGSSIIRYRSDGTVDFQIPFPTVYHVTACCFGGSNNDQIYVTTAHCGANDGPRHLQEQFYHSGHLFVIDTNGTYTGGTYRHEFAG